MLFTQHFNWCQSTLQFTLTVNFLLLVKIISDKHFKQQHDTLLSHDLIILLVLFCLQNQSKCEQPSWKFQMNHYSKCYDWELLFGNQVISLGRPITFMDKRTISIVNGRQYYLFIYLLRYHLCSYFLFIYDHTCFVVLIVWKKNSQFKLI